MQTTSYAVGPGSPPLRDLTIGDLLREAAEEVPNRVALIAGLPNLAETGNTVRHNTLGEYCTRGFHVMHGYFEMPEATGSGKIHKFVLRERWSNGQLEQM